MSDAVVIRAFDAADQAAVRRLVLAGLGDHFGTIDTSMNPDLDAIAEHYVDQGADFAVAVLNGEIVGSGALIADSPGVGRIVRMSVDGRMRGQGLGKRLVRHLLDLARSRGYDRVVLETNDDWWDAIGLYRSCGFVADGVRDGDIHMHIDEF